MQDYANPQTLNRYAYTLNNPIRYTDPTGHMVDAGGGGGCNKKCKEEYEQLKNKNKNKKNEGKNPPIPFVTNTPQPTSTPRPTLALQFPTQSCTTSPCLSNFVPSVTPTPTSTPTATPRSNNDRFPWNSTIPGIFNPGFAPTADAIWDIILGALPLINTPATSLNQIVNNTVNAVINGTSNALTNTGSAVNEAIGNGLNYGPVTPIFVIPSPYDLFPVTSQEPVHN